MTLRTQTPLVKTESTENEGPCLRWLAVMLVAIGTVAIALTHCGALFIH